VFFTPLQRVSSTVCTAFCVMPVTNQPHPSANYCFVSHWPVLVYYFNYCLQAVHTVFNLSLAALMFSL
jgi:hypothetical protein